jgi:3-hydroxyacyl-[acyl-carrier-protein] dehydratase
MEKIKRKNLVFDIEKIKQRLPHRFPFLMIDRILDQKPGYCKGLKNVTINEWQFVGHFPNQSIMPGMLIAECIAQTAAFVGSESNEKEIEVQNCSQNNKTMFLLNMNIKFLQPVIVGDQIVIEVKLVKKLGKMNMFYGEAKVDDMLVAKAEFTTMELD